MSKRTRPPLPESRAESSRAAVSSSQGYPDSDPVKRAPDPPPASRAGALVIGLQVLLALSYAVLSHMASARHDMRIAVGALAVLVLLVLVRPLLRGSLPAVVALVLSGLGIAWLHGRGLTMVPMLLVPAAFIGMVGLWFARSLLAGRVALITRIVAAIEATPAPDMAADLRAYTRALTLAWAVLLCTLALVNLLLACIVVPDGLFAQLGWPTPLSISRTQWSWFANVCNYGLMVGFFVIEFHARKRRFPGRYSGFFDFLRRLAGLGPAFWRDFLR